MKIQVAIVEDNANVRAMIREKIRYNSQINLLFECSNGDDFLSEMKDRDQDSLPNVVLMDLEMPVIDGIQAIAIGSSLYRDIYFIVLTVFDEENKLFSAIEAGAVGYLLKDDSATDIGDAIVGVYNHGAAPMSPAIARKTLNILRKIESKPQRDVNKITPSLLSDREMEILKCIIDGFNYRQIAESLSISPLTVRTHINNITVNRGNLKRHKMTTLYLR